LGESHAQTRDEIQTRLNEGCHPGRGPVTLPGVVDTARHSVRTGRRRESLMDFFNSKLLPATHYDAGCLVPRRAGRAFDWPMGKPPMLQEMAITLTIVPVNIHLITGE